MFPFIGHIPPLRVSSSVPFWGIFACLCTACLSLQHFAENINSQKNSQWWICALDVGKDEHEAQPSKGGWNCFILRKYRNYAWLLIHIIYILRMSSYINMKLCFTAISSETWLSLKRFLRQRNSSEAGPVQGKDEFGVLIQVLALWTWQSSSVGVP